VKSLTNCGSIKVKQYNALNTHMHAQEWHSASNPPPLTEQEFGWLQSVPVLGYCRSGEMRVVTFEDCGDDGEPDLQWFSCDSERWNVTAYLTHWTALPAAPV
jgi:hypothetical protein